MYLPPSVHPSVMLSPPKPLDETNQIRCVSYSHKIGGGGVPRRPIFFRTWPSLYGKLTTCTQFTPLTVGWEIYKVAGGESDEW